MDTPIKEGDPVINPENPDLGNYPQTRKPVWFPERRDVTGIRPSHRWSAARPQPGAVFVPATPGSAQ